MPSVNGVRVKIGGKERALRMTHRAMDRLERETGLSVPQVLTRTQMGHVRYTIDLIWSLLLHDDKALERDTVIDWLDDLTEDEVKALTARLEETFGEQAAEATNEGNVEAASTA